MVGEELGQDETALEPKTFTPGVTDARELRVAMARAGASVFPGARIEVGAEVRINGVVSDRWPSR